MSSLERFVEGWLDHWMKVGSFLWPIYITEMFEVHQDFADGTKVVPSTMALCGYCWRK